MSKAFVVSEHGAPDVMQLTEREVGAPGPGEIRVRNRAIGLNFVDTYQRSGFYPMKLPFVPGSEGAGEVTAVGPDVTEFKPGDRVCYTGPVGSYAEERLLPAGSALPIPDDISYEVAAAAALKGVTAWYLLHETWPLRPGETILVHAAAGGVGLILCQWAKALGARVIGTAGSPEKAAIASENGCDAVINYREEGFATRVAELTDGRKCDVVYDGVGQATFAGSLDCLRPRGLLASFGSASGAVSIPNLGVLATKGSLYVTRPTMKHYFQRPEDERRAAAALFAAIGAGKIRVTIGQRFPLSEAPAAHRSLESRQTIGSTLLLP